MGFKQMCWSTTKPNKMNCAASEDSDQPGDPPSLISLCYPPEEGLGPKLPIKHTVNSLIRLDLDI